MNREQIAAEALSKARTGQSFANYPAIVTGFMAKGLPAKEIKPRENVFTFHAWRALGRRVIKGEHGVKVYTYIPCSSEVTDPETGVTHTDDYSRPWVTTVFHISQTEEIKP